MTSSPRVSVFFSSQPCNGYIQWYLSLAKKERGGAVCLIDRAHIDSDAFLEQVSMSFLGQSKLMIIKDAETAASDMKRFDACIKSYEGPHILVLFTQRPLYQKQAQIVPAAVSRHDFVELARSLNTAVGRSFVEALFTHSSDHYSWQQAQILLHYAALTGQRPQQFFQTWFNRICKPDQSLFTLSGHFFGQDAQAFMQSWYSTKPAYGNEFWIAFWSEQLWQALMYIESVQEGNVAQGRKRAYRLPFSFFQNDHKRHTSTALTQALERLYQLDYGLKTGRDITYALDGLLLGSACNNIQEARP